MKHGVIQQTTSAALSYNIMDREKIFGHLVNVILNAEMVLLLIIGFPSRR